MKAYLLISLFFFVFTLVKVFIKIKKDPSKLDNLMRENMDDDFDDEILSQDQMSFLLILASAILSLFFPVIIIFKIHKTLTNKKNKGN